MAGKRFHTRFTYHLAVGIGPLVAWPTDDYLDAINHTYSYQECIRFDRAGTSMEDILTNAANRGWDWFNEDDYWFLRFVLNLQHAELSSAAIRSLTK